MLWPRKFFYSFRTCRACRGRQPLSQTHCVSSLGFSFSWDHMLFLLCLGLSLCITVFAHNFRSDSLKPELKVGRIKCLGSCSWSKPPQTRGGCPAVSPSVEESCMPVQLAETLLHLTFGCSAQITLRAHQGISASPWPAQGPSWQAAIEAEQSRPCICWSSTNKVLSVPQHWINKHLQRNGFINIEHEVSETVKVAQGRHTQQHGHKPLHICLHHD